MKKPVLKFASITTVCLSVILFSGCQSTDSRSGLKDPQKALEVRTKMAAEFIRSGDVDSAKRTLDQALEANPRHALANMMMGVLLQTEGSDASLAQADRYFKRAVASEPKNAQIRNNYATYLYQLKRYPEAIENLTIAGSTLGYDSRFRALENLATIYNEQGDTVNAEKVYRQALQANRDSVVSMIGLAEIHYLRQELSNAQAYYDQAVRLVGQNNLNARALWVGIRLARAQGDTTDMQVIVNQLRALFPSSPEYQRYLQLQYSTEAVWK